MQISSITNPALPSNLGGSNTGGDGGAALAITIGNLYQAIVMLGGLAMFLYLAYGGVSWITAGGDKTKLEDAKNKITNAIIGMAILVAIIAIVNVLKGVFGYDILNPTIPEPISVPSAGV